MALDAGMAQRRPKKKDLPESELRVPPMPKTADTPTYQTTIGGWSSKPVGANTIRPTDTTQAQKKQIAFDAPAPSPVSQSKMGGSGTARAVPDEGVYKSSTTTRASFTGGGRSFSDPTPKPPESELRISPMPQTKPKTAYDVLARTSRPDVYTEDNVLQYLDRATALASLPSYTDEQRKEAAEIANLFSRKFTNPFSGKESLYSRVEGGNLFHDWYDTVQDLDYKAHPVLSGVGTGLAKGVGATSIATAVSNGVFDRLEKGGVDVSAGRKSLERMNDDTYVRKNAPIASAAGEITGNVALTSGLAYGISSLGVPPTAAKALTFMAADAIHNVGDLSSGKMTGKEYLLSMGKSGASSLAGSLAGNLVNLGVADALRKHNLMTPFGEFTRIVASSLVQAGAYTAVDTAMSKEKPSTQEQVVTFTSVFALSALGQAVESLQTTSMQKTQMQKNVSAVQTAYNDLEAKWSTMTSSERERAAEDVKLLTDGLRRELATGYFGGQQTAVNQARGTLEVIDTLTDNLVRGLPDGTAQPDGVLVETIANGLTAGLENVDDVGYTKSVIVNSSKDVEYSEKKTVEYLLNPDHPVGGAKAKFMRDALGYTQNDAVEFHNNVTSAIAGETPAKIEQTQYGTKFIFHTTLRGKNDLSISANVVVVIQKDNGRIMYRIITVYPDKK